MTRLRLSRAARQDLFAIHSHSEEMFGLAQADRYAAGLTKALRLILEYPLSGRLRRDTQIQVRTQPYKSHVIIYAFDNADIVILRVRHAREDWINDPEGPPSEPE